MWRISRGCWGEGRRCADALLSGRGSHCEEYPKGSCFASLHDAAICLLSLEWRGYFVRRGVPQGHLFHCEVTPPYTMYRETFHRAA